MNKEVKIFFNKYPNAGFVHVVGERLYLAGFREDALRAARQQGVVMETIARDAVKDTKKTKADDATK
jgi:hypothetical protein